MIQIKSPFQTVRRNGLFCTAGKVLWQKAPGTALLRARMVNNMKLTTLCYIEKDDKYLMIHRIKKKHDVNKDKWIGIGGKFERGESPEDCILRETKEETGLTLTSYRLRGVLTFVYNDDDDEMEYIFLYTADGFTGELAD